MIRTHVLVCTGTGCTANGSLATRDALLAEFKKHGLENEIEVVETGCMGRCDLGPCSLVHPDGTFYKEVTAADAAKLVEEHFLKGRPYKKLLPQDPRTQNVVLTQSDFTFFSSQLRIVRDNCGIIDPENIEEYIARDGYAALGKVLTTMTPQQVIDEMKASGLRGRGGAGFPTGRKWELMRNAPEFPKYIVCNADEGDPGAFMNRSVLEGDPHSVLEGMAIGAYAMGSNRGFVYIRAEYGLAVKRLHMAIEQAYKYGLLGKNLFGSDFGFDLEVRIGAGAVPSPARLVGQTDQYQQRRDLGDDSSNHPEGREMVRLHRHGKNQGHESFLSCWQDQQYGGGGTAIRHNSAGHDLRGRRRNSQRQTIQGRPDRRSVRWGDSVRTSRHTR
jgi:(2Fe-2S) ferredoxin